MDLKTFKVMKKPELKKEVEEDPKQKKYRMDLYNKLLNMRSDIAAERDCMPYMVGSNMALMQMSKLRPKSVDELRAQNCKYFILLLAFIQIDSVSILNRGCIPYTNNHDRTLPVSWLGC